MGKECSAAEYFSADFKELALKIAGITVPYIDNDPAYQFCKHTFNQWRDNKPGIIAFCQDEEEVLTCLEYAKKHNMRVTIRSGGHNFEGYCVSDGAFVIDMSRFKKIKLDVEKKTATIQVGAWQLDVAAKLDIFSLVANIGGCPNVGFGGYAFGGGVGLLSRHRGTMCDNVLEARIILADGRTVVANDHNEYKDLFWALRGAGNGNFGIITEFTVEVFDSLPYLWGGSYSWPLSAQTMLTMIDTFYDADEEFNADLIVANVPGFGDIINVVCVYDGDVAKGKRAWEDLVNKIGVAPTPIPGDKIGVQPLYALHGIPPPPSDAAVVKSSFVRKMDLNACQTLVDIYHNRPYLNTAPAPPVSPQIRCRITFEILGGQINKKARDDNAFCHRDFQVLCGIKGLWNKKTPHEADMEPVVAKWASEVKEILHNQGIFSNETYQGYVDKSIVDWQHAYYGNNYPRLQQLKAKYDRDEVFKFAQSIEPAANRLADGS